MTFFFFSKVTLMRHFCVFRTCPSQVEFLALLLTPVVVQRQVLGCAMLGLTVDTYSASVQGGLHARILIFST